MRKSVTAGVVMAVAVCGLFAEGTAETTAVPGVTDTEVVVGFTMPLSGPVGFIGKQVLDATHAVFNRVNEDGGVHGRKLRVIAYDGGMDPAQTMANYRKLILEDRVFAVTSGFGSFVRPVYPLMEEHKVPWLFPLVPPEDSIFPPQRYLFSLFPTNGTQMRLIATWLKKVGTYPRIAVIYGDNASGKTGLERLIEETKGSNVEVVASEALQETAPSASVQVAKIRQANPDIVLIFGLTMQPGAVAIKEMRRVGMETQIMVSQPISNSVLLNLIRNDRPEGILGSHWGPAQYEPDIGSLGTPEMQKMAESIIRSFPDYARPNSNIGMVVEHGLNVEIFVQALERAGRNLTRERLIETLESFRDHPSGKGSPVTFSPTRREGLAGGVILQIRDGWWRPVSDWIDVRIPE